jgi:hypothetical protein
MKSSGEAVVAFLADWGHAFERLYRSGDAALSEAWFLEESGGTAVAIVSRDDVVAQRGVLRPCSW